MNRLANSWAPHSLPPTAHALPGPDDILRAELPNGIVVLSRANYHSPSVVFNSYLPAGAIFDPDEKLGLAHFTASALMRGTAARSFGQIYDTLESVGASLGISCGVHFVSAGGRALVEDLDMLLGLLGEALREPAFPQEQIERLRAQILTSLAIRAQDTSEMASLAFDQIVYDGHPYSRPEDGYIETVQAIRQADMMDYHRRHYGPRGMLITVVGAIDPARALERVAEALGDWHNPLQPDPPDTPQIEPLAVATTRKVTIHGKSQADLVLGVAGPARRSPDYVAAALGNNILGQFGMMGRIGETVREKAGLAYYAYSSLAGGVGPGPWYISAGVDPSNVEQAVALILDEVRRFIKHGVSQDELLDSQSQFIGSLPISLESNAGVAAALTNLERFELGLDYYLHYPDLIRSITAEQILHVSQRYLDPERFGIAIAGP